MMKRFLLSAVLFFAAVSAFAQQPKLPPKCKVWEPQALHDGIYSKKVAEQAVSERNGYGQSVKTTDYWDAYSDRANNTTYSSSSISSAKFSSLDFNEKVRIAQIENGMALVYVEKKDTDYPKISEAAVCRGWVPMSKLLLWKSCPTDEHGIYYKALLCINLDNAKGKDDIGYGYCAPDKKSPRIQLSTDMNFYFIMKRQNGMALLATQSKMDGAFSSQVLKFWVPEQSYVPWNQRSCLEPTWKHEDVQYFAERGICSYIYKDKQLSGEWISKIPFKKKDQKDQKDQKYEQYQYRMAGANLRYPILDDGTSTVFNMSTFSTVGGTAEGVAAEEKSTAQKLDEAKKKELEKRSHINLGIVIDGTSSMEPYYPEVKTAIKEGIKYFSTNSKVKVGVVIFRDYADGDAGLVEVMPLTPSNNLSRVNAFLDSGGSYGIKSSPKDMTQTEALYCGMDTALEKLAYRDGESNMMLVIGDCGNDANDNRYSKDGIIQKLVAKKISLMSFQVQNRNVVAYSSFNTQLTEMIRKSLLENYHIYNKEIKVKATVRKEKDGFDYHGNASPEIFVCNHRSADPSVNGGKMLPSKLRECMESSIGDFAAAIQKQLDLIVTAATTSVSQKTEKNVGFGNGTGTQDGINISEDFIKATLGSIIVDPTGPTLVNFRGYAKKQDESGRDFYKPVIFISREEFEELIKRMAPVNEIAKTSLANDRGPYIEAMKAMVKSFAPGMTDADMASLDNTQITKIIGGLNEAAESLTKYRLDDISNKSIVSNAMYNKIVKDFARKFDNLKKIHDSKKYEFKKEFNGACYYWIPIEDLP